MTLEPVYRLPRGMSPPDVHWLPNHLLLEYFRDGKWYHSAIHFHGVLAMQNRDNFYDSAPWHSEKEYVLMEVIDSPWKQQLLGEMTGKRSSLERAHHYTIKTRDHGTFDFIADGWELRPEREGCPSEGLRALLEDW